MNVEVKDNISEHEEDEDKDGESEEGEGPAEGREAARLGEELRGARLPGRGKRQLCALGHGVVQAAPAHQVGF